MLERCEAAGLERSEGRRAKAVRCGEVGDLEGTKDAHFGKVTPPFASGGMTRPNACRNTALRSPRSVHARKVVRSPARVDGPVATPIAKPIASAKALEEDR